MLQPRPLTIATTAVTQSDRTYSTNHMGSISHHIMPLVINSLRGGHTTNMLTDIHEQSNSKKPGMRRPVASAHLL